MPDVNDPEFACKMVDYLKPRYYALLAGGGALEVRFPDRWVKYAPGDADKLASEILRLEGLCAKSKGGASPRFAARLGAFR